MKVLPILFSTILSLLVLSSGAQSSSSGAQSTPPSHAQLVAYKLAAVKHLVESGNYVFHAQSALPLQGEAFQLTSDYLLTVSQNQITSYLPYFGRDYFAPADPSQGGVILNSSAFDYTITPRRKDGWFVNIKPKGNRQVSLLSMTITSNGHASLFVNSPSRAPISFMGFITPANVVATNPS